MTLYIQGFDIGYNYILGAISNVKKEKILLDGVLRNPSEICREKSGFS